MEAAASAGDLGEVTGMLPASKRRWTRPAPTCAALMHT
jgi:hypothetical protein